MNRFGNPFKPLTWLMAMLVAAFVAGCGGGGGDSTPTPPPVDPLGAVCTAGAACVPLATAGTYVILTQAGVSNVPTSKITGNIGVSPIFATALTGFSQTLDASGTFSTSAQVTGKLYAADYAVPTPANLTQAITDAQTAFNNAMDNLLHPQTGVDNPTAAVIDATLAPGVYHWTTDVAIPANVTLTGSATQVWIFRIDGNLSQAANTTVTLAGGALPQNIFWAVSGPGSTDLGAGANFKGIILTGPTIALGAGASVNGRLFAGGLTGAVTLISNTITRPGS